MNNNAHAKFHLSLIHSSGDMVSKLLNNNPYSWQDSLNPLCLHWCVEINQNNPKGKRHVNHNPFAYVDPLA